MNDLISRKALLDVIPKNDFLLSSIVRKDSVDSPAVNAEPIRHGKWIKCNYVCGDTEWKCSVCGETEWRGSADWMKFCMYCGAKMDGGDT